MVQALLEKRDQQILVLQEVRDKQKELESCLALLSQQSRDAERVLKLLSDHETTIKHLSAELLSKQRIIDTTEAVSSSLETLQTLKAKEIEIAEKSALLQQFQAKYTLLSPK